MQPFPVQAWSSLNPEFELPPGEIHLWRANLEVSARELAEYRAMLDRAERERADRLLRPQDRIQFTAARGLLRRLLGWYLRRDPLGLKFSYRPGGRPELEGISVASSLNFNVSHSEHIALLAFSRDRQLGVDIERLRERTPVEKLAKRFFAAEEASQLLLFPTERRRQAFFQLWTYKEAYLKAIGVGLRRPLAEFSVVDFDTGGSELRDPRQSEARRRWILRAVEISPNFAAALVYEAPEASLRLLEWR